MGKPRRGISLLLARFFLRPVVPSHLSLRPKNCSLRVTITFSTCAGSKRVTFVLFSEKANAISFRNDGKRGRSSNQGRTPTPVPSVVLTFPRLLGPASPLVPPGCDTRVAVLPCHAGPLF